VVVKKGAGVVKQISILLASLVLGVLVSVQWSSDVARSAVAFDQIRQTTRQLELEQEDLKQTVGRLREKQNARQREATTRTQLLQDLQEELTLQKMRAGLLGVRGEGVQVLLDDSQRGSGGNPNDFLIHDFDIRDVIQVLWLAGAEAIAVNGERVVNSTSVYCVGSTILVNDTRLSPPYQINAIGDPVQMQDYLRNAGYLAELKARSTRFGVSVEFARVDTITLPAYRGSLVQKFAQPGS
jgi:uncharacterized protein YlxW (UPF0749 family)